MIQKMGSPWDVPLGWREQNPKQNPPRCFSVLGSETAQIMGFVSDRINTTCETIVLLCIGTHCIPLLEASLLNCLLIATRGLKIISGFSVLT